MITKYQLITIGNKHPFLKEILDTFYRHVDELGIDKNAIVIIDEKNYKAEYKGNAPTFCLYFGNKTGKFENLDILLSLIKEAKLILPIIEDLKLCKLSFPEEIKTINAFELADKKNIESLVNNILEGFNLLRLSRRLFISYKRDESSLVAIQLFEQFEKAGFDVFLDTHSVKPGEPFQDELWHRLADTDVVVLLNTPGFLKSEWTTEELARANAMSIGILQILWPTQKQDVTATLTLAMSLVDTDFNNSQYSNSKNYLIDEKLKDIVSSAESLRARSLAARQVNIITEFNKAADKLKVQCHLQPEKFLVITRKDNKELVIIPTVGVPQALTYHQSEELVNKIKSSNVVGTYLLYDHINIREKWLNHLEWLNQYLKVKSIKIIDVENKIKDLVNEK